jgi:predicted RNA binding protein YcfA (HicA-like mRNA interferase family)
MSRLPRLTGKELLAALRRAGFNVVRITEGIITCITRISQAPIS